jgi:hypothetical protein
MRVTSQEEVKAIKNRRFGKHLNHAASYKLPTARQAIVSTCFYTEVQ